MPIVSDKTYGPTEIFFDPAQITWDKWLQSFQVDPATVPASADAASIQSVLADGKITNEELASLSSAELSFLLNNGLINSDQMRYLIQTAVENPDSEIGVAMFSFMDQFSRPEWREAQSIALWTKYRNAGNADGLMYFSENADSYVNGGPNNSLYLAWLAKRNIAGSDDNSRQTRSRVQQELGIGSDYENDDDDANGARLRGMWNNGFIPLDKDPGLIGGKELLNVGGYNPATSDDIIRPYLADGALSTGELVEIAKQSPAALTRLMLSGKLSPEQIQFLMGMCVADMPGSDKVKASFVLFVQALTHTPGAFETWYSAMAKDPATKANVDAMLNVVSTSSLMDLLGYYIGDWMNACMGGTPADHPAMMNDFRTKVKLAAAGAYSIPAAHTEAGNQVILDPANADDAALMTRIRGEHPSAYLERVLADNTITTDELIWLAKVDPESFARIIGSGAVTSQQLTVLTSIAKDAANADSAAVGNALDLAMVHIKGLDPAALKVFNQTLLHFNNNDTTSELLKPLTDFAADRKTNQNGMVGEGLLKLMSLRPVGLYDGEHVAKFDTKNIDAALTHSGLTPGSPEYVALQNVLADGVITEDEMKYLLVVGDGSAFEGLLKTGLVTSNLLDSILNSLVGEDKKLKSPLEPWQQKAISHITKFLDWVAGLDDNGRKDFNQRLIGNTNSGMILSLLDKLDVLEPDADKRSNYESVLSGLKPADPGKKSGKSGKETPSGGVTVPEKYISAKYHSKYSDAAKKHPFVPDQANPSNNPKLFWQWVTTIVGKGPIDREQYQALLVVAIEQGYVQMPEGMTVGAFIDQSMTIFDNYMTYTKSSKLELTYESWLQFELYELNNWKMA
ncbi:MAG TPA: hypothetical protein VGE55_13105 [Limnobacter sp.]|uniref:hypothetical protein n=1 Tax=Limnobacter sp. TaxID=2003368 RepID=UPI002EDB392C